MMMGATSANSAAGPPLSQQRNFLTALGRWAGWLLAVIIFTPGRVVGLRSIENTPKGLTLHEKLALFSRYHAASCLCSALMGDSRVREIHERHSCSRFARRRGHRARQ